MNIKIKKLRENAVIPQYATEGSAACDLCYAGDFDEVINPGETKLIGTGIAIAAEKGTVALIFARSGLATKCGIAPANCVGVIDSDYRGEIKVPLRNNSDRKFKISNGDRIAQLMFTPFYKVDFEVCFELDETERGCGGFGSTGI